MKKKNSFIFILSCFMGFSSMAQVFWTESFGTGCSKGQLANTAAPTASNGAWSTTSFTLPFMNGPDANEWYISAEEQTQAVGVCGGITCGFPNNRSLHVGANVPLPLPGIIDIGADYESGFMSNTNKRAETPMIDCSGHKYVQLSFVYLAGGIPGNDYCEIEFSDNGGASWSTLAIIPPSTSTQCPTTGIWQSFAIGLPSTTANNTNVKIGFHWYNNDPLGAHPSIAIDDIQLSELTIAGPSTVNCVSASASVSIGNNAFGNTSYTWSALPNTVTLTSVYAGTTNVQYPGIGTYTLMALGTATANSAATSTAISVVSVAFGTTAPVSAVSTDSILCTGSSATLMANGATTYTWASGPSTANYVISPTATTIYTVTGTKGHCISTYTIQQAVDPCTGLSSLQLQGDGVPKLFPNPFSNEITVSSTEEIELSIYNSFGQAVMQAKFKGQLNIPTADLPNGVYLLLMKGQSGVRTSRAVKN